MFDSNQIVRPSGSDEACSGTKGGIDHGSTPTMRSRDFRSEIFLECEVIRDSIEMHIPHVI